MPDVTRPIGNMPVPVFTCLVECKSNFDGCGTLGLPSADDIDRIPAAITKRLEAIKEVDLRKETVGFTVAGASHTHPHTCARTRGTHALRDDGFTQNHRLTQM